MEIYLEEKKHRLKQNEIPVYHKNTTQNAYICYPLHKKMIVLQMYYTVCNAH